MICYSINDTYRHKLYKLDNKQLLLFLEQLDEPIKERYLRIILADGYQILQRRKNEPDSDNYSKRLYSILVKSDFKHVKEVLEDNYHLLQILFVNAKQFWNFPIIDRCLLIEEKADNKDYFKLLEFDPLYLVDIYVYGIQKDIDSINHYYKDYLEKLGSKYLSNFYQLVITIMSKLKDENKEMYDKNFLEIFRGFYIGNKFMHTLDETFSEETLEYVDRLETDSLEMIAEDLSELPNDFTKIIAIYLAYQTDLAHSNDTKDFIDKNVSKEMVKKLKIDNN